MSSIHSWSPRLRLCLALLIPSVILIGCGTSTRSAISPLSGLVTDEVGVPIEDAQVQLIQTEQSALELSPGETVTAVTDEDGLFEIEAANEEVEVLVTKDGFGSFRARVGGRFENGKRRMNMDLTESGGPPCRRMDTNQDGSVTPAEWRGPEEVFLEIDTDQDGILSTEELEAMRSRRPQQRPERGPIDQDGDGVISEFEWRGPAALFEDLDTDENGTLTRAEMQAGWVARHGPRPAAT